MHLSISPFGLKNRATEHELSKNIYKSQQQKLTLAVWIQDEKEDYKTLDSSPLTCECGELVVGWHCQLKKQPIVQRA
jgi:hypothetical protein